MTTQADFAELLQKSEEHNLKLKKRIIELQNDLNHERIRAKQYQGKFKDALLQSQFSQSQDLLEKLNNKQNELYAARQQIIDLNRKITNTSNSPSQSDLIALARENEDLMGNIEQIKTAAISAIMMKQEEIQELNKRISHFQLMENQLKFQYEKYESLQNEFQVALKEKQEEIDQLNQKIASQRENFFNKLEAIQNQAVQQQNLKESFLQKAQDLQGTLQKTQMIISQSQNRIAQLQYLLNQQKLSFQHQKAKFNLQFQDLKQEIKAYKKEQKTWNKIFEQLKFKQKQSTQTVNKLHQQIQQLKHKLTIKKKKQSKQINDKLTSSFSGISKPNPVYASFAFRAKQSIFQQPKHLGDLPEMEDLGGLLENFDLEYVDEQVKKDAPVSLPMSKKKTTPQATTVKQQGVNSTSTNSSELNKQIENYKHNILRLDAQKKELQSSLNTLYGQLEKANMQIKNRTDQIQTERKNISELRQQLKKTKKESELIIEIQSLTLHVEKLQNDMIASKLKYAEEADFAREKYNREKVIWTQKLVQLTEKIAKQDLLISQKEVKTQQKKKKKGFFG